jgi:hypothetical protein
MDVDSDSIVVSCVMERVFSWHFKKRRLRVRYEKRDDIHTAFHFIANLFICSNRLQQLD